MLAVLVLGIAFIGQSILNQTYRKKIDMLNKLIQA